MLPSATESAAAPAADEARFQAAMAWLSSFTDYEQIKLTAGTRQSFDLGRLERLLARLGAPHRDRRPVVHVTGTKGKSSTVWMADALLSSHGLRTFRFISPHLESARERLAVGGEDVAPGTFADLADALRPEVARLAREAPADLPSFFECMTVMGFLLARRAGADATVLEVGLGGRLDATNVVDPCVAVITSIGLDHMRILGSTHRAIAAEKAGIIKPDRPVLCGLRPGDAGFDVIEAAARAAGAPFRHAGRDLVLESHAPALRPDGGPGLTITGATLGFEVRDLFVPGATPHQAWNALLALAAARCVLRSLGQDLEPDRVREAFAALSLPGRAELHAGPPPALLDGAHTAESIAALAEVAVSVAAGRRIHLLAGLTRDRDPRAVFAPLLSTVASVTLTRLPTPRSHAPESLAAALAGRGPPVAAVGALCDALDAARARAGQDGLLLVTGSLYLVGAVRALLRATAPAARLDRP